MLSCVIKSLKDELAATAIQITCYDRNGDEVKRVTSDDANDIEDDNTNSNTDNGSTDGGNTPRQRFVKLRHRR